MNQRAEKEPAALYRREGRVLTASGPVLRATGNYSVGEVCRITRQNAPDLMAEVVGFAEDSAILTPFGSLEGISFRSRVRRHRRCFALPISDHGEGRILDAVGVPIDGGPDLDVTTERPNRAASPNPMTKQIIEEPFETGIRAIDGFLTVGRGQRMGVFAAAGGGKSTLLSMLVRFSTFDKCVVALIGERGREVREFVEHSLGHEGMARTCLFVATSDRPAIEQVNAAYSATTLAEHYRDQGHNVLLLIDSLTRFARAQRQIGLSAGEPPTRRGFPPSVFEMLPKLLERTGTNDRGAITAFYTVLVEGDDMNEPVADEVRSLLDGHIVLSRKLAEAGHYPAIDVLAGVSRTFTQITTKQQQQAVGILRKAMSAYQEIELLIRVGEYQSGSDAQSDRAVRLKPEIDGYLQQAIEDRADYQVTLEQLAELAGL